MVDLWSDSSNKKLRANEATGLEVVGTRNAQGYPLVVIYGVEQTYRYIYVLEVLARRNYSGHKHF